MRGHQGLACVSRVQKEGDGMEKNIWLAGCLLFCLLALAGCAAKPVPPHAQEGGTSTVQFAWQGDEGHEEAVQEVVDLLTQKSPQTPLEVECAVTPEDKPGEEESGAQVLPRVITSEMILENYAAGGPPFLSALDAAILDEMLGEWPANPLRRMRHGRKVDIGLGLGNGGEAMPGSLEGITVDGLMEKVDGDAQDLPAAGLVRPGRQQILAME